MATRKSASKGKAAEGTPSIITWRKLPKGVEIRASGPKSAQLERIMNKAGLVPRAACYGGDTCIV